MAEKKIATGSPEDGAMRIDAALVQELAELLTANELTEIEVEDGDRRIKVKREFGADRRARRAAGDARGSSGGRRAGRGRQRRDDQVADGRHRLFVRRTGSETLRRGR